MTVGIENLESRTLFSATLSSTVSTDLTNLINDGITVKAQIKTSLPLLRSDLAAVRADLKGSGVHNAILAAKLHLADLREYATLKSAVTLFATTEANVARRIIVESVRAAIHPNNTALSARLAANVAIFTAKGDAVLASFAGPAASASAVAAADLSAITAANPSNTQLATDVNTVTTDGGAFVSAMQVDIQAIKADLSTLVSDASTPA